MPNMSINAPIAANVSPPLPEPSLSQSRNMTVTATEETIATTSAQALTRCQYQRTM